MGTKKESTKKSKTTTSADGETKAKTKKTTTASKPADHPSYKEMITQAVTELKERSGSSRQAIKKYIHANFSVGDGSDNHINQAIKRGVTSGEFLQPKGPSGPLKLGKDAKKAVEKKEKKEKKEEKEKEEKEKEEPKSWQQLFFHLCWVTSLTLLPFLELLSWGFPSS